MHLKTIPPTQPNDTQHNDIQHNYIKHNDILLNDTQYNNTQHKDTEHNDIQTNDTQQQLSVVYAVSKLSLIWWVSSCWMSWRFKKYQGPCSQNFIIFVTYKWAD